MPRGADARSVVGEKAPERLRALAGTTGPAATALRGAEAEGGLACLIHVWPADGMMPSASAERRGRSRGARARCREDVVRVIGRVGRALTRKEVIRALREAGLAHGPGTVGKALADLT